MSDLQTTAVQFVVPYGNRAPIAIISDVIFNANKSDYEATPLFLGEKMGLNDTVNVPYPQLQQLYAELQVKDWKHNEFDFTPCRKDFDTCAPNVYKAMFNTIASQWEADSIAAHKLVPLVAPFVSSTTLWDLYQRIGDNEGIHARTYSEMLRTCFVNPNAVIKEILAIQESMYRFKEVAGIFKETYDMGLKLQTGEVTRDDPAAYDAIFMFVCAMYCMERIQFMSSFAITFGMAEANMFVQFAKAVQKICADENEVHAPFGQAILDIELGTERGLMAFTRLRPRIEKIVMEVIASEFHFTDVTITPETELPGITNDVIKGWVIHCAKPVFKDFGMRMPKEYEEYAAMPPLKYMGDWMKLDKIQPSPMEERHGGYLIGGIISDEDTGVYDTAGL